MTCQRDSTQPSSDGTKQIRYLKREGKTLVSD